MKSLTFFLLFISIYSYVRGTSDANPSTVTLCDAHSERFGCDPRFWSGGNRLKCMNTTQVMAWATKPTRSDCYEIIAGDSEDAPVTSYVPGQILMLHVRVKCYNMLFRGIQIYGVDSTETKVGDWDMTADEPAIFKRPWGDSPSNPCFGTLMHASAEYKPYHSVLYYKAPAAGTGSITFRCLIKYGNANTGDFFWPKEDITLTEATITPAPTTSFYNVSAVGQSCSEFCSQTSGFECTDADLQSGLSSLSDPSAFGSAVFDNTLCVLPLLSGCGTNAGTYDPTHQYCYYPDPNCVAENRTAITYSCSAKDASLARFCYCTSQASDEDGSSAASTIRGFGGLALLALFFLNPRLAMFVMVMIGASSAHNWINSLSRSNGASTYQPFKPATSDMPHAQVGPGQAFQIEWMTAHGGYTYFAIVHSKNQDYMAQHSQALFEDYIKLAPSSAIINATSGKYQRFHRKDTNSLDNDRYSTDSIATIPDYFERIVPMNDSLWIPRPAVFSGRVGNYSNPTNMSRIYQMQYKLADLANDVRVSYQSTKYPWLDAVYRFKMSALQAVRPDVANFWIPGYSGYGRYIVQFVWSGYRDATDVDYMQSTVQDIYGIPPNSTRWRRIDHCLFNNPRAVYDVSQVVTDATYCLKKCAARSSCWGVNVVPLKAPETAYKGFKPGVNQTWFYPEIYGTDIYVPWNLTAFAKWKDQLLANASSDKFMCFSVMPQDFTDTTDEYTVSKDPDDPVFYSTCYYRYLGNTFSNYPDTTVPSVSVGPWRFNDRCVDCESQATNMFPEVTPQWHVQEQCINCDQEPSNPKNSSVQVNLIEVGVRCDGTSNSWSKATHYTCPNVTATPCVKQLIPIGRSGNDNLTLAECSLLASMDPYCSNTFQLQVNFTYSRCYCYSAQSCCLTCSRRADGTFNTYEITRKADPTCATGVLSADNKSCCSSECGATGCVAGGTISANPGFCCSDCITRPCSQYGPPCLMA